MDIKRILRNKSYQFLALVIVAVTLIIFVSSFTVDKVATKQILLNCASISDTQDQIKKYSKLGYIVISISPYTIKINATKYNYSVVSEFIYTNNYLLVLQK